MSVIPPTAATMPAIAAIPAPLPDAGGSPSDGIDAGSPTSGAIEVRRAASTISYRLQQAIENSFGSDAMEAQAELASLRSRHSSDALVSMLDSVEQAFGDDTVELRLFERAAGGNHSASEVDRIIDEVDGALSSDAMEEAPAFAALGNRVLSGADIAAVVSSVEQASSADEYESRILTAAFSSGRTRVDIQQTIDYVERRYSDDASEAEALVRAFGGVGGPTGPGDDSGWPGDGGFDPTYPDPGYPDPGYPDPGGYPYPDPDYPSV